MSDFIRLAYDSAVEWAREILNRDPSTWLILDTETTGLGSHDEVIQIGAIDSTGKVILDNILIKPSIRIPESAQAIHGISNEMVENAPRFPDIWDDLTLAMKEKLLVIYNADYDLRMLAQSGKAYDYLIDFQFDDYVCAMHKYAEWYGDWNSYHGSFRWQRLPSGDHSALGDCRAVLKIIKTMAKEEQ